MRIRQMFVVLIMLLCLMLVSGVVQAEDVEHNYVNDICTDCGAVGVAYIELEEDIQANWVLTQDLYLDLYGYDISGVINTNGYSIYLMDTTTWDYTCQQIGYFNCVDSEGQAIVPEKYFKTDATMTGFTHSYLTIHTQAGYSAHRFYLGITHTSLKPSATGLGYKALFCGDDMVKAHLHSSKAFGYKLQLENYGSVKRYIPADKLISHEPVNLTINNWEVEEHCDTPLYVSVQLLLSDGTQINSDIRSVTLRQQVEAINDLYLNFSEDQLNAVRALIQDHPTMLSWKVQNLLVYEYVPVDTPIVGTAYKLGVTISALMDAQYYINGSLSGYYMATDSDAELSPDVYLEQLTGGYALYFMNGSVKTYINVAYRGSGSSVCIKLVTDSTPTVYKFNTQYKYMYTTLGSRNYYIGTYTSSSGTTYTTLSASNTSYISDVSTIGVSQFPAWFYSLQPVFGAEDEPVLPPDGDPCDNHIDEDNNGYCDACRHDITIVIDFYAINDLHGKLADAESHPGVDELSTYLNNAKNTHDNVILLSSGDMWQGAAESNLTKGYIITEWMNEMDFVSMTLGNHEYDWGEEVIEQNALLAEFPFLAINVYDAATGKRVDYCDSSVVVDLGDVQIGIIGAIGDCYSSISPDRTQDVYFLTGSDLTALVKAEATKLRSQGVDFIVYSLHDGGSTNSGHYDTSLSNGYVDLVFEGHTHSSYVRADSYGVYHLQGGGDNEGITYAAVSYNTVNGTAQVTAHQVIPTSTYSSLDDDPLIVQLQEKYYQQISIAYKVLGTLKSKMSSSVILQTVASLYVQAGEERWGDRYDIVLGGGYLNTRAPYDLEAGEVTYGMLMNVLPFDNRLVLCSVSGSNLKSKFINNSSYYISYTDYGQQISGSISSTGTYYIVVDSYTAYYAPNKLTIIEFYDEDVYARDLLAEHIENQDK